jgi:cell division protein FtsB
MRLKGRHWVLIWIGVFLLTAAAVIGRQTSAFESARRVRELREQRAALEAERADLERRILENSSRRVLEARAQRDLGLHYPADHEFTLFLVPPGSGAQPSR